MADIALGLELAADVAPGEELGVIYEENGVLTDVVISSCQKTDAPMARTRTIALMDGRFSEDLYTTTHCDSGHLLASVASRDVLIP